MIRISFTTLCLIALAACTPGAATLTTASLPPPTLPPSPAASSSPTPAPTAAPTSTAAPENVTIDISLVNHAATSTPYGMSGGFSPAVTTVTLNSTIHFVNSDNFQHTATSFGGTTFPAASPFTAVALTQSGGTLSGGFSSGALNGSSSSQTLLADAAGTYLYGCFFHYASPMRGAIVVQ